MLVALCGASAPAQSRLDSIQALQEVEVVAGRRHEVIPAQKLERKQLEALSTYSVADAIRYFGGVQIKDYGGVAGLKTVDIRSMGTNHMGVFYDGIQLGNAQNGQIDLGKFSMDNMEEISLYNGQKSELVQPARDYGSSGTIYLRTRRPRFEGGKRNNLQATMRTGSFGLANPSVLWEHKISDNVSLSANVEYTHATGRYKFRYRKVMADGTVAWDTTAVRQNGDIQAVRAEAGLFGYLPQGKWHAKAYYYDSERGIPGAIVNNVWKNAQRQWDRNAFAQMQYRTWGRHGLSLKVNAKFNWAASEYKDATYSGGIKDASYWQREAYASACLLYAPTATWAFDYSSDYIFNNLNSSLDTDTKPYRHSVLQSATARYKNRKLTVTARLLHSAYLNGAKRGESSRDMSRLSPSVSLSFRPLHEADWYLRLSYKNIFRAPTFNESYFYHYGSTDLKPEITDQVNIGTTWRHGYAKSSYFSLSVDGYANKVKDKIVAVPYNMFVWTNINVGKVIGYGIEAEATLEHKFNNKYSILATANYAWLSSRNRTNESSPYYGNLIAYTPEHQGSMAVGFENPIANISVHGYGMSHRYTNNEHYAGTRIDGYVEVGTTAYRTWKLWKGEMEIRIDIKNLLDKQYEIVSHYPMPGRSWQASVKYKF